MSSEAWRKCLAGFNRTVERHCSVDGVEGLSLLYFNKPCLLKEWNEFSRNIVLCVSEAIKKLNKEKQPSHQKAVGAPPVSDMQLCPWFDNPEQFLRCTFFVFPRQVVKEQARNHTIEMCCWVWQVIGQCAFCTKLSATLSNNSAGTWQASSDPSSVNATPCGS